jgi:hypothetical protein
MQGSRSLAAAAVAVAMLLVPASAQATLSVTATGDDGNPVALPPAPGAPLALRQLDGKVIATADAAEGYRWSIRVVGPDQVPVSGGSTCDRVDYSPQQTEYVNYRGNGTYTVGLAFFAQTDATCAQPIKQAAYQYTVGASVAIGQPAGAGLTRQPGSYSTLTHELDFNANPGAITYEIKYAKGGVIGPDGAIQGVSQSAYLNRTTGKIEISAREPGDYVIVARAKNDDYYTAWSAPVRFRLMAPFDLVSVSAVDARGPSFKLRGTVREPTAAGGRVTVAIAKGKHGKKFRTLGKARVNSKGVWTLRFTVRKYGNYRVRYSFAGNATVLKGAAYESVRIKRVLG